MTSRQLLTAFIMEVVPVSVYVGAVVLWRWDRIWIVLVGFCVGGWWYHWRDRNARKD